MPRKTLLLLLPLALSCTLFVAGTESPAVEVRDLDARVLVGPSLRQPALDLDAATRDALRREDWDTAATRLLKGGPDAFPGSQRGDWAFVLAWSLVHAERAVEAEPYLPLLDGADAVPAGYADLVRGEVLYAKGDWIAAIDALDEVQPDHRLYGHAAVLRAEALKKLGRTSEAWALYETLIARPDPAIGTPEALLALALHAGIGSDDAYRHLRRLWWAYPGTESEKEGAAHLATYTGTAYQATWQEVGRRGEVLMNNGQLLTAIAETDAAASRVTGSDVDACRFAFVRGRSNYRKNQLSNAIAAFGDLGDRCDPTDPIAADYGQKILFLKGTAHYRKGEYTTAAITFEKLASRYPSGSFADDGLLHAGIALQEAKKLPEARALWLRSLETFPGGDTVPEATWRLAFSHYLDGNPTEAIAVAERLGALPLDSDAVHVAAGRYWAARWKLYPDVAAPTTPRLEGRAQAIAEWEALCRDLPHSWYAIVAYSRLVEEAPDVAAALAVRPEGHSKGDDGVAWQVRQGFWEHPGARAAVDLVRLGLIADGLAEWKTLDPDTLEPDEVAWMTEARIRSGDWLFAHDAMRQWLKKHPPDTLGPRQPQILRVGYPDRYWEETQAAAKGYSYEPRLLHALSREESNFNASITSHAGARGLTQLMPATAREVAGWLGRSITDDQLDDPVTNLTFGARYFESMHKSFGGSPYAALAAYNAGGGRVRQWRDAWGDVPTDEYVERIPFKETREYVKRVMGTWQTMRYQFDDGPAFPDLSKFNHDVVP